MQAYLCYNYIPMIIKTSSELRNILAEQCEKDGTAAVALKLGRAEVYILQVLSKHRDVSKSIANQLGYKIVIQPKPEKIFAPISTS